MSASNSNCAACNKPLDNGKNYASMGGNIEPYMPSKLYHMQCIPTIKLNDIKPYFVEVDNKECPHCGMGQTWTVIGPDGYADSTSYDSEEDAQSLAEKLNVAFHRGQIKGI